MRGRLSVHIKAQEATNVRYLTKLIKDLFPLVLCWFQYKGRDTTDICQNIFVNYVTHYLFVM